MADFNIETRFDLMGTADQIRKMHFVILNIMSLEADTLWEDSKDIFPEWFKNYFGQGDEEIALERIFNGYDVNIHHKETGYHPFTTVKDDIFPNNEEPSVITIIQKDYSNYDFSLDFTIDLVREWVKAVDIEDPVVIQWSNTSEGDEPCKGGGAIVITADETHIMNTENWVFDKVQELKEKSLKTSLMNM